MIFFTKKCPLGRINNTCGLFIKLISNLISGLAVRWAGTDIVQLSAKQFCHQMGRRIRRWPILAPNSPTSVPVHLAPSPEARFEIKFTKRPHVLLVCPKGQF